MLVPPNPDNRIRYKAGESSKLQNYLPPGPPYALSLMKPRSLFSEYMIEREGACTQRKSAVTPTASETARTGVTTRRSKYQRMPFTPSPPPASSLTIKDLYPQFHKLFRHTFGRKISPFRQQSQTWLRSLGKKSVQFPLHFLSGRVIYNSEYNNPDLQQLPGNTMEMRFERVALWGLQ